MLVSVLIALPLLALTTAEDVEKVSARAAKNLLHKNWGEFRKDASFTFSIEEYQTGYDQYFTKDAPKSGYLLRGKADYPYIAHSKTIQNIAKLPGAEQKLFQAYCGMVKESREYSGPKWEWPDIYGSEVTIHGRKFPGPGCSGRIASNVEWGILFAKVDGKWKAQRLILVSH